MTQDITKQVFLHIEFTKTGEDVDITIKRTLSLVPYHLVETIQDGLVFPIGDSLARHIDEDGVFHGIIHCLLIFKDDREEPFLEIQLLEVSKLD